MSVPLIPESVFLTIFSFLPPEKLHQLYSTSNFVHELLVINAHRLRQFQRCSIIFSLSEQKYIGFNPDVECFWRYTAWKPFAFHGLEFQMMRSSTPSGRQFRFKLKTSPYDKQKLVAFMKHVMRHSAFHRMDTSLDLTEIDNLLSDSALLSRILTLRFNAAILRSESWQIGNFLANASNLKTLCFKNQWQAFPSNFFNDPKILQLCGAIEISNVQNIYQTVARQPITDEILLASKWSRLSLPNSLTEITPLGICRLIRKYLLHERDLEIFQLRFSLDHFEELQGNLERSGVMFEPYEMSNYTLYQTAIALEDRKLRVRFIKDEILLRGETLAG